MSVSKEELFKHTRPSMRIFLKKRYEYEKRYDAYPYFVDQHIAPCDACDFAEDGFDELCSECQCSSMFLLYLNRSNHKQLCALRKSIPRPSCR